MSAKPIDDGGCMMNETRRQALARTAMLGLITRGRDIGCHDYIAAESLKAADAMLRAERKERDGAK